MAFSREAQTCAYNNKAVDVSSTKLVQLEREDKLRHAREFSTWLLNYAKQIEAIRARNKRLEQELSFDAHAERDDPFYNEQMAGKLGELFLQGSNVMLRLEIAKQELSHLDQEVSKYELLVANQREKNYAIANYNQTHLLTSGKIRKLEHDLDRRVLKMNEKLRSNRRLYDTLDTLYNERLCMDAVYTKRGLDLLQKQQQINRLENEVQSIQSEVSDIEKSIEDTRQDGQVYELECTQRANKLLVELTDVGLDQHSHKYIGPLLPMNLATALEKFDIPHETIDTKTQSLCKTLRKTVNKNRWICGQAKATTDIAVSTLTENLRLFQQIHQLNGTTTVDEVIQTFHAQEAEHFARMQLVNSLAQELEERRHIVSTLRERIGRVKSQNYTANCQKAKQVQAMNAKIERTLVQTRMKKESAKDLTTFLDDLRSELVSFHTRLGYGGNLHQLFHEIEERATTILEQNYSTKIVCNGGGHNVHIQLEQNIDPKESNLSLPTFSPKCAKSPKDFGLYRNDQIFRYGNVDPPQLCMDDLGKRDVADEAYAYTYDELKSDVWPMELQQ
ncbi:unnamed protein product [Albugo candida]|uniref:ODAD1 central coiled coil region domain-containing protein n=2 Tax=Albugo candida TaxID=65357 RepID=A0A024G0I7_9STRA|nr:unnamed protein product [Albugo candida]|eukprot:CCI40068.1 unnamed protein product [Albugo candida]